MKLQRGFKHSRKKIQNNFRNDGIKSCITCKYYNKEEECTNNEVTEFDMYSNTDVKGCILWIPTWAKDE